MNVSSSATNTKQERIPMSVSGGSATRTFELPPLVNNERGEVRKAGFELEYAGIDVVRSAEIVREVFGGQIEVESTFVQRVTGTRVGDFAVEIDTVLLKDKQYEQPMRDFGIEIETFGRERIENLLLGLLSTLVPIEIVAPPI